MKIAFYCRVDGQGFGFVLPEEAAGSLFCGRGSGSGRCDRRIQPADRLVDRNAGRQKCIEHRI